MCFVIVGSSDAHLFLSACFRSDVKDVGRYISHKVHMGKWIGIVES